MAHNVNLKVAGIQALVAPVNKIKRNSERNTKQKPPIVGF